MKFIAIKTDDGTIKGKTAFYCGALNVTRQGFYWYLKHRDIPWKYKDLAEKMSTIAAEDECNDTYGRCRMCQALTLKYPNDDIPSERTVYRVMEEIGLSHRPNRKPNGIRILSISFYATGSPAAIEGTAYFNCPVPLH